MKERMLAAYIKARLGLERFLKDEEGASAIEYAIIAGLIAVGIITAAGLLGDEITNLFTHITTTLSGAQGTGTGGGGGGGGGGG